MKAASQARFLAFLGSEDVTGQYPLQRLLHADHAWQEPAGTGFRHDPALAEHETELGAFSSDAKIHRQRHGDTDTDGGTIDRRNHRLVAVVQRQRQLTTGITDLVDVKLVALG